MMLRRKSRRSVLSRLYLLSFTCFFALRSAWCGSNTGCRKPLPFHSFSSSPLPSSSFSPALPLLGQTREFSVFTGEKLLRTPSRLSGRTDPGRGLHALINASSVVYQKPSTFPTNISRAQTFGRTLSFFACWRGYSSPRAELTPEYTPFIHSPATFPQEAVPTSPSLTSPGVRTPRPSPSWGAPSTLPSIRDFLLSTARRTRNKLSALLAKPNRRGPPFLKTVLLPSRSSFLFSGRSLSFESSSPCLGTLSLPTKSSSRRPCLCSSSGHGDGRLPRAVAAFPQEPDGSKKGSSLSADSRESSRHCTEEGTLPNEEEAAIRSFRLKEEELRSRWSRLRLHRKRRGVWRKSRGGGSRLDGTLVMGIETSCDDTCVGILEEETHTILANIVISQSDLLKKYGGVHPSESSSAHRSKIFSAVRRALSQAGLSLQDIDVIAFTRGPGLVPCLSVGAKAALEISAELGATAREALGFLSPLRAERTDGSGDRKQMKTDEEEEEGRGRLRGREKDVDIRRQSWLKGELNGAFEMRSKWREAGKDKGGGVHTLPSQSDPRCTVSNVWLTPREREALVMRILEQAGKRRGEQSFEENVVEEVKPLVLSINHLHGHILSAWMKEDRDRETPRQDTTFSAASSSPHSSSSCLKAEVGSPPPRTETKAPEDGCVSWGSLPSVATRTELSDSSSPSVPAPSSSSCASSFEQVQEEKRPFLSLLVSGGHTLTSIIRPCQDAQHLHVKPKTFTLHLLPRAAWGQVEEGDAHRRERKEFGGETEGDETGQRRKEKQGERETQCGDNEGGQHVADKTAGFTRARLSVPQEEDGDRKAGESGISNRLSIDVDVWGSWSQTQELCENEQHASCVNGLRCVYTGQTEDDAAGEAIDKSIRTLLSVTLPQGAPTLTPSPASPRCRQGGDDVLGETKDSQAKQTDENEEFGSRPGGALMEALGTNGDPTFLSLPKMLVYKPKSLNFSFSGLKAAFSTAVRNKKKQDEGTPCNFRRFREDCAASLQGAVVRHLEDQLRKTLWLCEFIDELFPFTLAVTGGVSRNELLRKRLLQLCQSRQDLSVRLSEFKRLKNRLKNLARRVRILPVAVKLAGEAHKTPKRSTAQPSFCLPHEHSVALNGDTTPKDALVMPDTPAQKEKSAEDLLTEERDREQGELKHGHSAPGLSANHETSGRDVEPSIATCSASHVSFSDDTQNRLRIGQKNLCAPSTGSEPYQLVVTSGLKELDKGDKKEEEERGKTVGRLQKKREDGQTVNCESATISGDMSEYNEGWEDRLKEILEKKVSVFSFEQYSRLRISFGDFMSAFRQGPGIFSHPCRASQDAVSTNSRAGADSRSSSGKPATRDKIKKKTGKVPLRDGSGEGVKTIQFFLRDESGGNGVSTVPEEKERWTPFFFLPPSCEEEAVSSDQGTKEDGVPSRAVAPEADIGKSSGAPGSRATMPTTHRSGEHEISATKIEEDEAPLTKRENADRLLYSAERGDIGDEVSRGSEKQARERAAPSHRGGDRLGRSEPSEGRKDENLKKKGELLLPDQQHGSKTFKWNLLTTPKSLCNDNGIMIAWAAVYILRAMDRAAACRHSSQDVSPCTSLPTFSFDGRCDEKRIGAFPFHSELGTPGDANITRDYTPSSTDTWETQRTTITTTSGTEGSEVKMGETEERSSILEPSNERQGRSEPYGRDTDGGDGADCKEDASGLSTREGRRREESRFVEGGDGTIGGGATPRRNASRDERSLRNDATAGKRSVISVPLPVGLPCEGREKTLEGNTRVKEVGEGDEKKATDERMSNDPSRVAWSAAGRKTSLENGAVPGSDTAASYGTVETRSKDDTKERQNFVYWSPAVRGKERGDDKMLVVPKWLGGDSVCHENILGTAELLILECILNH